MADPTTTTPQPTVQAIKGFSSDWTCRDFQFAPGGTYTHEGAVAVCRGGFHAIPEDQHPLAVFDYYAPGHSRFARATLAGDMERREDKIAARILTVGEEMSVGDLAREAVAWVTSRAIPEQGGHATGDQGAASATGDQGAASATGDQGAASTTGDRGAASATGYQGAASATGYQGTASTTGDRGAASATGYQGAASTSNGASALATTFGRVRGETDGCPLFAVERSNDDASVVLSVACGITGRDGIAAGTWYRAEGGKLVLAS